MPEIDAAMTKAEVLQDPEERADAWAAINKQVTEQAPAVPYQWEKAPLLQSSNVNGVATLYLGQWDLSFTSLK